EVANRSEPLPQSGRSSRDIIDLANYLVRWTKEDQLTERLRDTFFDQEIEPTEAGDPQANPENGFIYIDWDADTNITPEREINRVGQSLQSWLPDHPDWTVAVLVPENSRGFKMAEYLKEHSIPYEELLRSTSATRDAAGQLRRVIDLLANPTDTRALAYLYRDVWWRKEGGDPEDEAARNFRDIVSQQLFRQNHPEDFLWPGAVNDALDQISAALDDDPLVREALLRFRAQVTYWLAAIWLPIDQLLLTVAQDLFTDQADLALAHKIAVVLRGIADSNPDYRLKEMSGELQRIASNQRRFLGFDDAASGYEPRPGVVTIATIHAAKGLEWDRVYLLANNNYSFPAAQAGDSYISEKSFVRGEMNVQAEARRQTELLMADEGHLYVEGVATQQARIDYASERLRLLYVGITRAKRDLIMTWNMGRFWDQGNPNTASAALMALHSYWKDHIHTP
ncbi:MAG: ATP-dependent helicase, partial [Chloroflexi bacterium]|nr:ATP-dependent helicase [Chloroflexota bacterium]